MSSPENNPTLAQDFIRTTIRTDLEGGKHSQLVTRFPPEPNGYLHIGHAKSICLNFGVAEEFQGICYLRFDDTNPEKESVEYTHAIQEDVRWLGFDWETRLSHASDYFEALYEYALTLIRKGAAYVCSLNAEEIREYRGTLTSAGKDSPYRNRSIEENLELFQQMQAGTLEEGSHVLRAKIDMASPNMNLRDPAIYRIRHIEHHRTGNRWKIYPMYDFTHCLSDAIEGITHSLCTLEFEDHRPLYNWFLEQLDTKARPQQMEFSRLFLKYTVTSKRKLNALLTHDCVDSWSDPRMPTISGLRRRGYTPESIRLFCKRLGVSKNESWTNMSLLEDCVREDLDPKAHRAMCVLKPLRIVITNYPEGESEILEAARHPKKPEMGKRQLPFSRELYIEQDDFRIDPPRKFFRLGPGKEVRLRYAYIIRCEEVIYDDSGEVIELRCTYDPDTKSGSGSTKKVKGVIHWVSATESHPVEVRVYDRLFTVAQPNDTGEADSFLNALNSESVNILENCYAEPELENITENTQFQFERLGYFAVDKGSSSSSSTAKTVFNQIVSLRNNWSKIEKQES